MFAELLAPLLQLKNKLLVYLSQQSPFNLKFRIIHKAGTEEKLITTSLPKALKNVSSKARLGDSYISEKWNLNEITTQF